MVKKLMRWGVLLCFALCCLPVQAAEYQDGIRVRLYGDGSKPIVGASVSIRPDKLKDAAEMGTTDHNGEVVFHVQEGAYLIDSDITPALQYASFREKLDESDSRLYYLSPKVELKKGKILILHVDPKAYIDIVDWKGTTIGSLRIRRERDDLDMVIHPEWRAKKIRFFLPLRLTYRIGAVNDRDYMLSPRFYAAPGACYYLHR